MRSISKVENNIEFTTKLKDKEFLRVVDKSTIGVIIIQRGHLKYFNMKFAEIFGYSQEEILQWKKREFYKIVHPDDLPILCNKMKVETDKIIIIRYRGVKKDGSIINIENYVCRIQYDNKFAVLSSYCIINNGKENYIENKDITTINLTLPSNLYDMLSKISKHKKITIEQLVLDDLEKLVEYYKEQFRSIGLFL